MGNVSATGHAAVARGVGEVLNIGVGAPFCFSNQPENRGVR